MPGFSLGQASLCLGASDLITAEECIERAERIAPRALPLKKELREHGRNLRRRKKTMDLRQHLSDSFDTEPANRSIAIDLARHLIRSGQELPPTTWWREDFTFIRTIAPFAVWSTSSRKNVPDGERAEAERRTGSGKPRTETPYSAPSRETTRGAGGSHGGS